MAVVPPYGAQSVGTTPIQLLTKQNGRVGALIQNNHASQDVYIGSDANVTSSNGIKVPAGQSVRIAYAGAIWAVASGAGTDVRYFE